MIFLFFPLLIPFYVIGYLIYGVLWGMYYAAVLIVEIITLLIAKVADTT